MLDLNELFQRWDSVSLDKSTDESGNITWGCTLKQWSEVPGREPRPFLYGHAASDTSLADAVVAAVKRAERYKPSDA